MFDDHRGEKPWWARWPRAQPHRIERVGIAVAGWRLPSLTIAVLADLHVGGHPGDITRFEGIVAEVSGLAPDLIVMPGDFVNMMPFGGGRVPPEVIAEILRPLDAPLGVFAVLGNHDNELSASQVGGALRDAGITVLENETANIPVADKTLTLLGLTDARSATPDHGQLAGTNFGPGGIVIAHDPASFAHMPGGPSLMICGHTHGGQLCLPGRRPLINMSTAPLRWTAGHIHEDGRDLYISRGLGVSALPFRSFAPPEISILTLSA